MSRLIKRPADGTTQRYGFGVVILAMVLVVCVLGNMWLRAPLIAQFLGSAAYAIALVMSLIAICMVALILKDEAFEDQPAEDESLDAAMVEVPILCRDADRRG